MDWANRAVAKHFAAAGHLVHLVGFTIDDGLLQTTNIYFHRVPKPLNSYFLGFFLLERYGQAWAKRITAQGGRVIVNGGSCVWADINWVHYLHVRAQTDCPSAWQRFKLGFFLKKEKAALLAAKVVVTTAESNRADLYKYFQRPLNATHVVPIGVDSATFSPVETLVRSQLRARWQLKIDQLALCFVGSLDDDRKGFDTLYQVWKELHAQGAWNHHLYVAGSGSRLAHWKAMAARDGLTHSVHFLGFYRDVPQLLKVCDAIAVPSRYEPYSLAAQEGVASGLPCFISQSCGFADQFPVLIRAQFVLDPNKQTDWKRALLDWSQHPNRCQSAIKPFSQTIRKQSWEKMAEQFESILFPSDQRATA